jgi:ribosomal protein S4
VVILARAAVPARVVAAARQFVLDSAVTLVRRVVLARAVVAARQFVLDRAID